MADTLMEPLGRGFREAVRKCFSHDGVVVIMFFFEFGAEFVESPTGRDHEGTNIIQHLCRFWRDKVCQRLIEVALRFSDLLAERVERHDYALARFFVYRGIHFDVVAYSGGRPKHVYAAGPN